MASNIITLADARSFATSAGFRGGSLEIVLAIAQAESSLNTAAINVNKDGSIDRGVLQINDRAHPEVLDACAYDPQCSFQQAYNISNHGTNFCSWCTYTTQCGNTNCQGDGKYQKYLSGSTPTGSSQTNLTVAQVFAQNGLEPWWNEDHANYFGDPGEYGQDYGMHGGFGTPVGCIWAGEVVDILFGCLCGNNCNTGSPDSVGYVVQVKTNDGLHHYQHLKSIKVKIHDAVQVGTVLGTSGGCGSNAYPSTCTYPNPQGSCGCTSYDDCSAGNHIEVRWSPSGYNPQSGFQQNWKNPLQHFRDLANKQANAVAGQPQGSFTGAGLGTSFAGWTSTHVKLKPGASVDGVLYAIDSLQTVRNPFDLTPDQKKAAADSLSFPGGSFQFTDPSAYIGDVMLNFGADLVAVVIDVFLILTGIYIVWKSINKVIDLASVGRKVEGGVSTGIQLGSLLAL
jgi:lysozyme-like protein